MEKRRTLHGGLIGLACGLLAWLALAAGLADPLENLTWDWRLKMLARPARTSADVVVIALDQGSLTWASQEFELGWPWPRQVYEPILAFLKRAGAKAVVFDVLFTEPSDLAGDDEALGEAIAAGPPLAGAVVLTKATEKPGSIPQTIAVELPRPAGLEAWLPTAGSWIRAEAGVWPIEEVAAAATCLGDASQNPDRDQAVRRAALFRIIDGRFFPGLALAGYLAGRPGTELRLTPGRLELNGATIPIDPDGRAVLNYRGPPGTHAKYAAAAVIQSEMLLREGRPARLDPAMFKGKWVCFGLTAPGLHDLKPSPMGPLTPGVEIQATILDNLLNHDFVRPVRPWAAGLVGLVAAAALGLFIAAANRPWLGLAALVAVPSLFLAGGATAYQLGLWAPIAAPALGAIGAIVGTLVLNYAVEGRQKRFIRRAFNHYLAPEVINAIIAQPDRLKLGGERRELTIFFSDLAGFTSLSEGLEPEQLTGLLNDYLGLMTDIILDSGGALDKYEGDAIIAFWNAPLDQPDHAARACRAALACQRMIEENRDRYKALVGQPLAHRIGLNTGPVVVGNMGSGRRFDYTVLGDAANLASRLEGANKVFGGPIMISEATRAAAGDKLIVRELGRIRVVGRAEPVLVHQPLAWGDYDLPDWAKRFQTGLDLVATKAWAEAAVIFEALPDDPAARTYANRCRYLAENDSEDWDGVWSLTGK